MTGALSKENPDHPRSGSSLVGAGRGADWSEQLQVDEEGLKRYLASRQHGSLLASAAQTLKETLSPAPTSCSHDGVVHMGDSLLLLSHQGGERRLLMADITEKIEVVDTSLCNQHGLVGHPLSTGKILYACPRNVFTISRGDDDDGFGQDDRVHFGQRVRIGTSPFLTDKTMYLYVEAEPTAEVSAARRASPGMSERQGANQFEVMAKARRPFQAQGKDLEEQEAASSHAWEEWGRPLLFSRGSAQNTIWRVLRPQDLTQTSVEVCKPVGVNDPIVLENEATGALLATDSAVCTNRYGNENRVFSTMSERPAPSNTWCFVDDSWTQAVVAAARKEASRQASEGWQGAITDPRSLLTVPRLFATEDDIADQSQYTGQAGYSLCARVFPLLRAHGMHGPRRMRRMCFNADSQRNGTLPARGFEGILSYMGIKLEEGEFAKLLALFEVPPAGSEVVDYVKFHRMMQLHMPKVRVEVVQDAYMKLQGLAGGGCVNITDLTRNFNPMCYPEVRGEELTETEALEDFLRQWDVVHADGDVSWEEFLDYYRDVSLAIEKSAFFVELVRQTWNL